MINSVYIVLAASIVITACSMSTSEQTGMTSSTEVSSGVLDSELIDILSLDSTFVLDIRYATDNNFTGQAVYTPDEARCLLRKPVAEALVAVHADLKDLGYRLKIFDCYRPIAVQQRLFEVVPNPDYVAEPAFDENGNPIRGSKHNRGAAVDLTLITTAGEPVDMPTDYDDFSERAHPDDPEMSEHHRANVRRLANAMTKHGFTPIRTEWWHFDGPNWESYPLQ
jgi:beta-N-acetylhexosaminidase/D-alanyl-D-alanine dipeptidase